MRNSDGNLGSSIFSAVLIFTFVPYAVQAQCSRPTGKNMHLSEEYFYQTSFPTGSKAFFACDSGFTAAGPMSVVCFGDSWSPIQGGCKSVICGSPGEVLNGWYDVSEGTDFGSVAVAHCHEGYRLVGMRQRTCKSMGWSDRVAVCEAVQCGPPPKIDNGVVLDEKESYSYGATDPELCTVTKQNSFSQTHPRVLVNPTMVEDVSCPDPVVENAAIIESSIPPFKYRSYVTLECLHGYSMNGHGSLTCEIDSELSFFEKFKRWLGFN